MHVKHYGLLRYPRHGSRLGRLHNFLPYSLLQNRHAPLGCSSQTSLYNLKQVLVLQCCLNSLLVIELLVDGVLGLMSARFDPDVHSESGWKCTEQANSE